VAPANSDKRDQILIGSKEMAGSFNSRSISLTFATYSSFVTVSLFQQLPQTIRSDAKVALQNAFQLALMVVECLTFSTSPP
jgi:hypothetical protein